MNPGAGRRRPPHASGRAAPDARVAALEILTGVFEQAAYTNLLSDAVLRRFGLDARERAFASALVYGTVSRVLTIDRLLDERSKMPLVKMEPRVRTILRMGVWQLLYSRSVPPHAACSESVRLTHRVSNRGAAGMVNGILRRLAADPPCMDKWDFAMRHALPDWLAQSLHEWYGPDLAERIALAFNQPARFTVRVNRLRAQPQTVETRLREASIRGMPGAFHPDAWAIDLDGHPLENIPGFADGWFMAQGEAAMLVATLADPQHNWDILDLCAAPGGKTCHLAELTGDRARVEARDQHAARLRLVAENARRLGLTSIRTRVADATRLPGEGEADSADLVLCDVPCSGLGLLAKKPDIRLVPDPQGWDQLRAIQREILLAAAEQVRPGGMLVYSTCTINPGENQEQMDWFLRQQAGRFQSVDIAPLLPAQLTALDADLARQAGLGRVLLLPGVHPCDGFFIAKLRRIS